MAGLVDALLALDSAHLSAERKKALAWIVASSYWQQHCSKAVDRTRLDLIDLSAQVEAELESAADSGVAHLLSAPTANRVRKLRRNQGRAAHPLTVDHTLVTTVRTELAAAGDVRRTANDSAVTTSDTGPMPEFRGDEDTFKSRSLLQQPSDCSIFEGQLVNSKREEHVQTTEIHHKYADIPAPVNIVKVQEDFEVINQHIVVPAPVEQMAERFCIASEAGEDPSESYSECYAAWQLHALDRCFGIWRHNAPYMVGGDSSLLRTDDSQDEKLSMLGAVAIESTDINARASLNITHASSDRPKDQETRIDYCAVSVGDNVLIIGLRPSGQGQWQKLNGIVAIVSEPIDAKGYVGVLVFGNVYRISPAHLTRR